MWAEHIHKWMGKPITGIRTLHGAGTHEASYTNCWKERGLGWTRMWGVGKGGKQKDKVERRKKGWKQKKEQIDDL